MPPSTWSTLPPPPFPTPPPRKPKTRFFIGLALLALLVVGVVVYAAYQYNQQQILQAAQNSEQGAASQASSQIRFTCFDVTDDRSNLYTNVYGNPSSGYLVVDEKFGLSNPTRFFIEATWTIKIDYAIVALVLSDTESFHIVPNGIAHPVFAFKITASQLNSLSGRTTELQTYTVILDANYGVTGSYGTYYPTQHLSYDSASNTGSSSIGSDSSLPKC